MDPLIKRYSDGFDLPHGGGIERARHHLSAALREQGAAVHWYARAQCADAAALLSRADQVDDAAVLPLVDHSLFYREAAATPPALRPRVVGAMTRCDPHAAPRSGECGAAPAHPGLYAADVFFRDEAWTRCFPRHRVIPWAVAHPPQIDYRDRRGPVPLQAGKSHLEHTVGVIEASRYAWSSAAGPRSARGRRRMSRRRSTAWAAASSRPTTWSATMPHLRRRQCSAGPQPYHETFNFLAAEFVHFVIPMVTFECSGTTRAFASLVAPGVAEFRHAIAHGALRALEHLPRTAWGWRDMAAYAGLVSSLRPALHASTT